MNTLAPSNPMTLPALVEQLAAVEANHLEDVVLPLSSISMTANGTIEIPNRGEHSLSAWSTGQIGSLLGFRWDKFFAKASPIQRQDEINRRLRRAHEVVKLRTAGNPGLPVVRAVVSPSYQPIPDTEVAEIVVRSMATMNTDLLVSRVDVSDRSTSYVIQVGEPQKRGGIVGSIWGGIMVKNSDVGWSALGIVAHLVRLACKNGLRAPLPNAGLLRARHRNVDVVALEANLQEGLKRLPTQLQRAADVLELSAGTEVTNVESEIRDVLRNVGLVRRSMAAVMAAYRREPHRSAFGISQALTLAAQGASAEDRLLLEETAGRYIQQKSS
jgi:hypothetical protein